MLLVEDGAAGSKVRWGWQPGGMAGMAEEQAPVAGRRGRRREAWGTQLMEPGSCQPDFICISCLRPWGHLEGLAKPMFFRTFLQKKTAALCLV